MSYLTTAKILEEAEKRYCAALKQTRNKRFYEVPGNTEWNLVPSDVTGENRLTHHLKGTKNFDSFNSNGQCFFGSKVPHEFMGYLERKGEFVKNES